MNPELQAILDKITSKEISTLTEYDIAFLRARISYLTDEQKEKFASVLEDKPKKEKKNDKKEK